MASNFNSTPPQNLDITKRNTAYTKSWNNYGFNYSLELCDRNMCLCHLILSFLFRSSCQLPCPAHVWLLHQLPTSRLFHFCLSHTWLSGDVFVKPVVYCVLCNLLLYDTNPIDFYPSSILLAEKSYNLPVFSEVKCSPQPRFQ